MDTGDASVMPNPDDWSKLIGVPYTVDWCSIDTGDTSSLDDMLKTKCVASLDVIFNKVLGSNVIDDISGLGVLIDNDETSSLVVISQRRLDSDGKEGFSLDDTSNIGLDITAIKEESMWDVPLTIGDGSMLDLMYKALDEINESNLGVSINSELMPMNGLDSTDGSNLCIILDTELESIDGIDGSTLYVILSNGL